MITYGFVCNFIIKTYFINLIIINYPKNINERIPYRTLLIQFCIEGLVYWLCGHFCSLTFFISAIDV